MINIMNDFGWVMLYIVAFGISDLIVKKYIKTDSAYVLYYLSLGCIGYYIVFYNYHYTNCDECINDKITSQI